ncbi:MAG TPA: LuxR C-terminal-related transcriptional regulator [Solirubrobacteraceae bacterium]|jgi:PAS domain S-box-containing protein
MTETNGQSPQIPHSVGAAAEAVRRVRGDAAKLKRIVEHSHVPMVMVDGRRRYIEANRPARLAFRLSLDELRALTVDDHTPSGLTADLEQTWARLLDTGWVAGRHRVTGRDGSRFDIVYCGLAHVLPGLQLAAFAPADWPEGELEVTEAGRSDPIVSLTPRELEVLTLAADGLGGLELAERLVLSPATVRTHFKNIYEKFSVQNRAAAVAKAMRLGVID